MTGERESKYQESKCKNTRQKTKMEGFLGAICGHLLDLDVNVRGLRKVLCMAVGSVVKG